MALFVLFACLQTIIPRLSVRVKPTTIHQVGLLVVWSRCMQMWVTSLTTVRSLLTELYDIVDVRLAADGGIQLDSNKQLQESRRQQTFLIRVIF